MPTPPQPTSPPAAEADPIVGIDLGTTFSLAAYAPAGGPPGILAGPSGERLLPSVVRFTRGQPPLVGWAARQSAARHPRTTIASVKRLMGRGRADAAADLPYLTYEIVEGEGRTARVRLPWGQTVSPQEVSALLLAEIRERASAALGVPVRRAVVTVPAYFDDAQRQATRDAGRLAGLEVLRVVNEPTAAALAYGLGLAAGPIGTSRVIVVYDFGGGTFDVSVLRLTPAGPDGAGGGGADFFEVLATAGDTHLGGDDLDRTLVSLFRDELAATHPGRFGAGVSLDPELLTELTRHAERAKIALSERDDVAVRFEVDADGGAPGGAVVYERVITRAEYEALAAPLVERTLDACRRALRDARRKLAGEAVDAVVLVGGSTRTPLVRRRVAEVFGVEPYTALNPDEVVALGAAVQARVLAGGAGGAGGAGAGSALLLDVIPLSLGIETVGGAVAKLIVRNASVPARATELFSTSVDNQTSIKLAVYQGEREMAADCRLLATFHLGGLPPMPAGIPQVQVDFHVDANGILSVAALERRSGRRAAIQIVPNHGLSREEVARIERESVRFARADMTRHRVADLIANARLDAAMIRRQLGLHGGRLAEPERAAVETALVAVAGFIARAEADWQAVDADEFQQAKEALDRASLRLHELSITATLAARVNPPG